jgi:phenylalanyl-tRNA synthetase beta chain
MRLDVDPVPDETDQFRVRYPAFRTDIRHMVDVFEDLAIGYGYVDIEPMLVPTMTVGQAREEEIVSQVVRTTLLGLGYSEVMSLPLDTEEDHFKRLRTKIPEHYPRIDNPKLVALKVVRTHLVTGLLQALYENRKRPMPLHLFEIDNIVLLDSTAETGVREERRVAFVEMGPEAGYAAVRGVLDAILSELELTGSYAPSNDPIFIKGRSASITTVGEIHGRIGELHPEVITGHPEDISVKDPVRRIDAPPILEYPVALGELILCRVL